MMEAFLNSPGYQVLAFIVSLAIAVATIVWKISQFANKVTNTLDLHTSEISDTKKDVAKISEVQHLHNVKLAKAGLL